MKIWETFQTDLISVGFTSLTAVTFYLFRSRTRLVWGKLHEFTFLVPGFLAVGQQSDETNPGTNPIQASAMNVHTSSIVVRNAGTLPATEVEVTFNWTPANYNIWPVRPYTTHESPDRRFTLKFANVAPNEQFQIELFSIPPLPQVLNIRCRECVGKLIPMWAVRKFARWVIILLWTFIFFGIAFVVEMLIKIGSTTWSGS
jgi:hypothetical protein